MKFDGIPRIRILSFFIALFTLFIGFRLFYIQIIHGNEYSNLADRQYVTPADRIFDRGSIFFRERSGELASAATLRSGFTIAISPQNITDPEEAYRLVSAIIPLDYQDFIAKALKKDDPYEEIARRVEKELADKINTLKITGLSVYKENWRFYPANELAARVIGFVGYNNEIGRAHV